MGAHITAIGKSNYGCLRGSYNILSLAGLHSQQPNGLIFRRYYELPDNRILYGGVRLEPE